MLLIVNPHHESCMRLVGSRIRVWINEIQLKAQICADNFNPIYWHISLNDLLSFYQDNHFCLYILLISIGQVQHHNTAPTTWITSCINELHLFTKIIWMNENSELSSAYGGQVVRQVFWGKTARSQLAFIFLFVFVCKATLSWVQHTVGRFWSIRPQGPSLPNLTSHTWTLDLKTKWWRKMCQRGTEHKARHSWLDWRG